MQRYALSALHVRLKAFVFVQASKSLAALTDICGLSRAQTVHALGAALLRPFALTTRVAHACPLVKRTKSK
jgi:hypothetical protein